MSNNEQKDECCGPDPCSEAKMNWRERVIDEKVKLDKKITKLAIFIDSDAYSDLSPGDAVLLENQIGEMTAYSETLNERIGRFSRVSDIA